MRSQGTSSDASQLFRERLARLRREAEMTPAKLAERMKDRGHSFHRQTIQSIESGDRKVEIGEAVALASIFDVDIEALVSPLIGDVVMKHAETAAYSIDMSADALRRALEDQYSLAKRCDDLAASAQPDDNSLESAMELLGVKVVVGLLEQATRELEKLAERAREDGGGEIRPFSRRWLEIQGHAEGGDSGVDREGE